MTNSLRSLTKHIIRLPGSLSLVIFSQVINLDSGYKECTLLVNDDYRKIKQTLIGINNHAAQNSHKYQGSSNNIIPGEIAEHL